MAGDSRRLIVIDASVDGQSAGACGEDPEMEFGSINAIVADKVNELRLDTPATWAACAAIWTRTYASATPGWARWPAIRSMIDPALMAALSRSISDRSATFANHVDALGSFDIEDDGSDAWHAARYREFVAASAHVRGVVVRILGSMELGG